MTDSDSSGSKAKTRQADTAFERRRRKRINDAIEELRALMEDCDAKTPKARVLESTIRFVRATLANKR